MRDLQNLIEKSGEFRTVLISLLQQPEDFHDRVSKLLLDSEYPAEVHVREISEQYDISLEQARLMISMMRFFLAQAVTVVGAETVIEDVEAGIRDGSLSEVTIEDARTKLDWLRVAVANPRSTAILVRAFLAQLPSYEVALSLVRAQPIIDSNRATRGYVVLTDFQMSIDDPAVPTMKFVMTQDEIDGLIETLQRAREIAMAVEESLRAGGMAVLEGRRE